MMMMTTGHTHFYTEIKQFITARLPSWRGEGAHPLLLLSSACSISNIRPPRGAHIATILVKISITSRNTAKMLHPLQTKFPLEERGGITLCMQVCMSACMVYPFCLLATPTPFATFLTIALWMQYYDVITNSRWWTASRPKFSASTSASQHPASSSCNAGLVLTKVVFVASLSLVEIDDVTWPPKVLWGSRPRQGRNYIEARGGSCLLLIFLKLSVFHWNCNRLGNSFFQSLHSYFQ